MASLNQPKPHEPTKLNYLKAASKNVPKPQQPSSLPFDSIPRVKSTPPEMDVGNGFKGQQLGETGGFRPQRPPIYNLPYGNVPPASFVNEANAPGGFMPPPIQEPAYRFNPVMYQNYMRPLPPSNVARPPFYPSPSATPFFEPVDLTKRPKKVLEIKDPKTLKPISITEEVAAAEAAKSPEPVKVVISPPPVKAEPSVENLSQQMSSLSMEPEEFLSESLSEFSDDYEEYENEHVPYVESCTYNKATLEKFKKFDFVIPESFLAPIDDILTQGPVFAYRGAGRRDGRGPPGLSRLGRYRDEDGFRTAGRRQDRTHRRSKREQPVITLPVSINRWVRPEGETSIVDTCLRKLKGFLNRLTVENLDRISLRVVELLLPPLLPLHEKYPQFEEQLLAQQKNPNPNQEEADMTPAQMEAHNILTETIEVFFEKAVEEPRFSPLYAQLCANLVQHTEFPKVPVFDKEGKLMPISYFKQLLLTKCQMEYETKVGWSNQVETTLDDEKEYTRNKLKRRTLGNIVFIAHLFHCGLLNEAIIYSCIRSMLNHIETVEEEELECCCQLLTTVGPNLDARERVREYNNKYFDRLRSILTLRPNLPARIRFMVMDVLDLRAANWDKDKAALLGKESMSSQTGPVMTESQQQQVLQDIEKLERDKSTGSERRADANPKRRFKDRDSREPREARHEPREPRERPHYTKKEVPILRRQQKSTSPPVSADINNKNKFMVLDEEDTVPMTEVHQ